MNLYSLLIGLQMISSMALASELTVNLDGKDTVVQYRNVERQISEQDRNTGNQNGSLDCSLLYYSLLAKGDIHAASQLTTDAAAAAETWQQYRERLGAADFQNEMAAYFTSRNRFVAEVAFADEVMLLVKTPDRMLGQIYRHKDGKYFIVAGRPMSDASRVLGKVLNMINDGRIKL